MSAARRGLLRQGDVLLIPVDRVPNDVSVAQSASRLILAEGEATGHAHAVVADNAELVESPDGTLYLIVGGDCEAALVHEEHDTIPLWPGTFEVRRQREYVPAPQRKQQFRRLLTGIGGRP